MNLRNILILLGLLALPFAATANEAIKIGDETFSIPIPAGFVRFDGLNPELDKVMQSMLPPTNRSLMVIATPIDAARAKAGNPGNLARFMNIQTVRKVESEKATLSDFKDLTTELEKQFAPGGEVLANAQSETNQRIKDAKLSVDLKLGEVRPLGIYEKTPQSVDLGLMMKTQVGTAAPETMVAAASFVDLRGKVLFLYVYADFHNQADVDWTRTTAKTWRESILATNPGDVPPGGFDWNSVLGKAVIGGIIGAVIGLLIKMFKR